MKGLLVLTLCAVLRCVVGQSGLYNRVLLTEAAQNEGAVCLDGTPAVYYLRTGSGENTNKWILHLMGGGWCSTAEDCLQRSTTDFGSSRLWPEAIPFAAFLSSDPDVNPDFYDWNSVFLVYCDGGSFAGNREDPQMVDGNALYYRGYRNLQAIIGDLNAERGLGDATDVILTGCSAGAVSAMLHANFVGTLIPQTAKYRVFPDAGYFPDVPPDSGFPGFNMTFTQLLELQDIDEALVPACVEDNNGSAWRCLVGPVMYGYVETPSFILNSQYDSDVLGMLIDCSPPDCGEDELAALQLFKMNFDDMVQPVLSSPPANGYFLDSCYIHCQTMADDSVWTDITIRGRSMRDTFGDWYFERSDNSDNTRLKDCETYPCNPTCPEYDSGAMRSFISPSLVAVAFLGFITAIASL